MAAVSLQRIDTDDLLSLAQRRVPRAWRGRVAAEALPPDFVAARSLGLQTAAGQGAGLAGALFYMVAHGEVVGSCGFKNAPEYGWFEIGYGVAPAHRGRSLGTQAVAALCELAFASGGIHSVRACIEPANAASGALARRLGFVPGPQVMEDDGTSVIVWTLGIERRAQPTGGSGRSK